MWTSNVSTPFHHTTPLSCRSLHRRVFLVGRLKVELARVNGKSTETSTEVTRRRLFSAGENEEEVGGGVRLGSGWGWSDEKGGQERARNRRLQTAVRGFFLVRSTTVDLVICGLHLWCMLLLLS